MSERTDASRQGADKIAPWPGIRRLLAHAPRLLALLLAGGLAAAVIVNWDRWIGSAGPQWTDDAAAAADLTPLSAQVGGRISAVPVNDFQPVHAGDTLARIDDAPFRAQVDQAQASVAGANAAIANLAVQEQLQAANIAAAEAQLDGARATAVRNHLEADRQHRLLATRIVGTEQAVEQADAAAKLSDAQVLQADANVEAAQRQLDVQHSQEAQLAASLKATQAALDLAQINLGYTTITSPVDGMVGQRRVYPGQYVGIGTRSSRWCRSATSTSSPTTRRPSSPTCASASPPKFASTLSLASFCMATSHPGRQAPDRSSRCCRPTMRLATSPRSCSAYR
jgi:membrane fusion protein (multidrug efflux system)